MTKPDPAAQARRDAARERDGKFGVQPGTEATGIDLGGQDDSLSVFRGLLDRNSSDEDWDDTVASEFPGLRDYVMDDRDFNTQMVMPVFEALQSGDDAEAQRLVERLHVLDDRELAIVTSGWEPGHSYKVEEDYLYGDRIDGEFYDPRRSLSDVSKMVRHDIKAAVEAGYLPDEYTYRVRTSSNTVRILVEDMPDEEAYFRDRHSPYANGEDFVTVVSWQSKTLRDRLQQIGDSYASTQSNSQVDFFNDSHYTSVDVEHEGSKLFWAHEKELAKMKKAVKTNPELAEQFAARRREMDAERAERSRSDREKWLW